MQADFVAEVIELLDDVHVLLDTSGFGPEGGFSDASPSCLIWCFSTLN